MIFPVWVRWLLGNLTLKLPVITMRCWYHYYFKDAKLYEELWKTPGRAEIQKSADDSGSSNDSLGSESAPQKKEVSSFQKLQKLKEKKV